ncbi:MAG: single-stranded DNA-binding protein, partial [Limosilactobacillus fermentum]|nr:single-stranded DNA-binding protein [Limosilactobacillus fermentum]
MLNRVVLTGRLTRDPELTYTQSGTPVLRFSIAVDRQFKNRETGRRDADFINCVIWRTSAENFARFTHKGALVGLDGRLSTSNYENQQGQRVYRTEVTVENFALLEPRSANNGNGGSYNGGGYNNGGNGFNNQGQSFGNNAYGNGGNFGAAPQNNFGGSPAPANQSYNGNFNQPQGSVFNQGPTQIDADS